MKFIELAALGREDRITYIGVGHSQKCDWHVYIKNSWIVIGMNSPGTDLLHHARQIKDRVSQLGYNWPVYASVWRNCHQKLIVTGIRLSRFIELFESVVGNGVWGRA